MPFMDQLNKASLCCMVGLPQLHLFAVIIPFFCLNKVELAHSRRYADEVYFKKGNVK